MKIGIVTALPGEARTLRVSSRTATAGHGCKIDVSGPGPENANAACRRLLDAGVDGLLSWGTAGALSTDLLPGQLTLYDHVVDAAGNSFACDGRWNTNIEKCLEKLTPWRVSGYTVSRPTESGAQKREIERRTGCQVVDMETASIGAFAITNGLPFVALRCIVDTVDFDLPQTAINAATNDPDLIATLADVMRRPHELPRLFQLARHYRVALRQLRRAARELDPDFVID
jgi:nucleoside phosphorylase